MSRRVAARSCEAGSARFRLLFVPKASKPYRKE
jgi:hypothetical protein